MAAKAKYGSLLWKEKVDLQQSKICNSIRVHKLPSYRKEKKAKFPHLHANLTTIYIYI